MIALKFRTVFNCFCLLLGVFLLSACGGNGTFSPTGTAAAPLAIAVTITPSPAATFPTGTVQFQAQVAGTSNQSVTWSVVGDNGGSISSTGLFTAPGDDDVIVKKAVKKSRTSAVQYTVQAVSAADPTKSATAIVNVTDLLVTITPANPTLVEGAQQQFTGTVTGPTSNKAVSWYVNSGGTITTTGLFTAPFVPGTYQVLCYSTAQNGDIGYTDVTVVPPSGITISVAPQAQSSSLNQTTQFTATVGGTSNQAVTWAVQLVGQSQYGSVSSTGLYTAPGFIPGSTQQVVLTATSVADPSKTASTTITIVGTSSTPGPLAAAPFALGLLGAWRKRKKASR
jgi:MYXO-CTERM domain-containing protein